MKKIFIIPPIIIAVGLVGWQIDRQRQAQAKTRTLLAAETELLEVLEAAHDIGTYARVTECNAASNYHNVANIRAHLGPHPLEPQLEEKFHRWVVTAKKDYDRVEVKVKRYVEWSRNMDERITIQKRRVAEAEGKQ